MSIADIRATIEHKMQQSVEAFRNGLAKIRTGRPNPALLDTVHVDYYGSMVPVSQVANLSARRTHHRSGSQEKGMGAKIEKRSGIQTWVEPCQSRDLICASASDDGGAGKELTKVVRGEGEGAKIAIRNLRRDANESVKKLSRTNWLLRMTSGGPRRTSKK